MSKPEPKGELSEPTKSLKALPKEENSKEEAEKEVQKSLHNTATEAKKGALIQI